MLKALRENLKYLSWVLWIVIAAFVGALFFDFGAMTGAPGAGGDAAAHVAGEAITFSELREQHAQLDRQYREMFGAQWSSELAEQLGLERQAIEMLVNRKVLLHEAGRLGLAVSDAELRREIRDIPVFREDGRFVGAARYAEILRANNLSPDRFESSLREDLLLQKVQQALSQNLFLSDAEVERALREESERATIAYLELPAARMAEVTASRAELERHLADNPDAFRLPSQRRIAYLLVDRNRIAQEVTPGDTELEAYYRENQDDFRVEEQVAARHILLRTGGERSDDEARRQLIDARQRIAAGEDFAALVAELSEEPGAAERGGDLGFFGRGAMVPEFETAAFGGEVGEIVGPIETPFGLHLLEVTGRRPAGVRPFAEVRSEIAQRLRGEQAAERARALAGELAGELRQSGGGVEAMEALAADRPSVRVEQPPPFAADGFVAGLGRVPELAEAAFTLGQGGISQPIEVPRGWVIAVVQEALPARVPDLAEAEPQVRRVVEQEKRQRAAVERLEQAAGALSDGGSLEEVAAELGVEVVTSEPFGANDPIGSLGSVPEVNRSALELAEGAVGGPVPTTQGAVLFRVISRQRFDPVAAAGQRDEVRARLIGERLNRLQAALIQHRREELGVTYSREVAESLQGGPQGT
ncbi:MAG TPA: SurA N-terminal domain-containing protein [Thermoanaerobaculia bacterium]|nr:SurA N-terminal domain-containing protein [Thermoanaerobaculia bacterium]